MANDYACCLGPGRGPYPRMGRGTQCFVINVNRRRVEAVAQIRYLR